MTDETKTPAPERLQRWRLPEIEATLAESDGSEVDDIYRDFAQQTAPELFAELRAAWAAEERLTSQAERGWTLAESLARELGAQLAARLTAEGERDEARRTAELVLSEADAAGDVLCGFAFDLGREAPALRQTECVYCGETAGVLDTKSAEFERWRQHAATCPKHPMRAVEADRDAAQKEAERLRELMSTLVYWHDRDGIDASWWDAARDASKKPTKEKTNAQ